MKSKQMLTLDDVKKIAAAAEAEALANNWAVVISVVDDGGHLLLLHRLDGAPLMSVQIAPAKAKSAALGKRDTKIFEDIINNGRIAFMTAPGLDGLLEGGVAIFAEGQCVGAVGISGVKSTEDVQIAKAGIAALGL
jgi:glc operon protein GlcG